MSFTSPLLSLTPIFLSFPPIHMFLIHSSFRLSLHLSARPCVVFSPARSGQSLYPSFSLSLHLSICHPFAASNHPITPLSPLVFFSPLCQTDGSLSDDRGHGCRSLLSLSASSFSQFILVLPVAEPPCDGSFSPSSSHWPLMSPCANLLPCHHACDVLISPAHSCRGTL